MMQPNENIANNATNADSGASSARRIEPLFDSAFVRVFGREESKPLTRGLVNAVLRRVGLEPVGEIERIDAEHTEAGGSVECKTPRMDVRVVAAGRLVDLEAQRYPEDVDNRSLHYGAQLLVGGTPKGKGYKDLPQVVVITLLDAPSMFPDAGGFAHACRMRWDVDGGEPADGTDRMLFAVVELSKVRGRYNELDEEVLSDELLTWAYLLTKGYEDDEEVARMMQEVPDIGYFAELYGLAVDDPKVRRAYEDALSAEREYQSRQDYFARLEREGFEKGREEGLEKGREEGREKGREEGFEKGREEAIGGVAAAMREAGLDEETIQGILGAARRGGGE